MLTVFLVVLVAIVVYALGPKFDGQPALDLWNLLVAKIKNMLGMQ